MASPQRRPDPEPVNTDERKVVIVGLVVVLVVLSALWLFAPDVLFGGRGYVIGTIVAALVIGAGGFLWAALRKR